MQRNVKIYICDVWKYMNAVADVRRMLPVLKQKQKGNAKNT